MAEHTAIAGLTTTLQRRLEEALEDTFQSNRPAISACSPKKMLTEHVSHGISLWLYRLVRNEHRANHPQRRIEHNIIARPSLALNLHYLITPIGLDEITIGYPVLGRILQVFNDDPIIYQSEFQGELAGSDEEIHIVLESLTMEEMNRIWGALQEPYHTCLSYLVHTITIDSSYEPASVTPVTESQISTGQILDNGGKSRQSGP